MKRLQGKDAWCVALEPDSILVNCPVLMLERQFPFFTLVISMTMIHSDGVREQAFAPLS